MLDTFEIGGINYEMGDFIVNPSESAVAAREKFNLDTDGNIQDIVVATSALMEHAYTRRAEGTFINALYRGYHRVKGFPKIPYAEVMHPRTVWEYNLRHLVKRPDFPDAYLDVPDHRQYGYLHWFNASTKTLDQDFVPDIERVFPAMRRLNFEFGGTYGEIGVKGDGVADRNYRAQVEQARSPVF
jgi:hypothetical protein